MMLKCVHFAVALFLLAVVFNNPAFAQYREYLVAGKVVDKDKHPIGGADIKMLDQESGRTYFTRTDDKGIFEFDGIPHAVYSAVVSKAGYVSHKDTWNYEKPQREMHRVDVLPITLLSEAQDPNGAAAQALQAATDSIAQKVEAGDCEGAMALLNPLSEKHPDNANILYLQGVCLLKKNSVDAAMEKLQKVVAADPTFAPAQLQLGMCYQKSNMLDKALESYRKALELDPKNLPAAYDAGMILYNQKKSAEALPFFEKALALKPDEGEILEAIAYCHLQSKDIAKTVEYLERAMKVEKDAGRREALEDQIRKIKGMEATKP